MRAALALMMLAAASCGSDPPGLRLELLAGDTGATSIELYLGTRPCNGCDGKLAPKGVTGKLEGEVWYLDGSAASGTPNTAAVLDGGSYVYDLRTPDPDKDARIAHVLVVGYDDQKHVVAVATLGDVPIYHAATEWWRVTMHAASEARSSDELKPAGDRVYVWRRTDPALAACVGFEQASDSGVERKWFVPEDDTDCDQVMQAECDPYTYKASGKATIQDASCVTAQFSVPNTTGKACLLGGPACIDGVDASTSCGPVGPSYCLPDAVCANSACAQNLGECLRDGTVTPIPRIQCTLPFDANTGGVCTNNGVPARHAAIDLRYLLALPSNPQTTATSCKSILFADPMLHQANVSNKIAVGSVEVKPDPITAPCLWGMTWVTGTVSTVGGAVPPVVRMTVVELQNGNRMLIPIELRFAPTSCTMVEMMCSVSLQAADSITRCGQVP